MVPTSHKIEITPKPPFSDTEALAQQPAESPRE
jgi:hypothetical protein